MVNCSVSSDSKEINSSTDNETGEAAVSLGEQEPNKRARKTNKNRRIFRTECISITLSKICKMKREEILNDLGWRYATKRFNREASIDEKDYQAVKEAIRLAPTSYGLQPFKVIEIEDRETRTQLQAAGYGQKQIVDASRLMAIASLKSFDNDLIDRYINLSMETRGLTEDEVSGYSNFMKGVFSQWSEETKKSWSEKQAYLALGFGMLAAAELNIDTCALEGIDIPEVNKILQLEASDYHVSVLLALGKRAEEDENQHLKKVRLETSVLFETI